MVADNTATNGAIADKLAIPMIGFANHRLNIAIKNNYLHADNWRGKLVNKINHIMMKLRDGNNAAKIRKVQVEHNLSRPLAAKVRNVTRWSSTYEMLKRYQALEPFINTIENNLANIQPDEFLTHFERRMELNQLIQQLGEFEIIAKELQSNDLTINNMLCVRGYFDHLIREFPDVYLETKIGTNADMVHNKDFENAIVKVLGKKENELSEREMDSIERYKINNLIRLDNNLTHRIRQEINQAALNSNYDIDQLSNIITTSNDCERLFSQMKLIFSPLRKAMLPKNLESVIYLKLNRSRWSVKTIGEIERANRSGFLEEDEVEEDDDESGEEA